LTAEQSFDIPHESQNTYRKAVAECFSQPPNDLSWENKVEIVNVRHTVGKPVLSVDTVVLMDAKRPKLPSRGVAIDCLRDTLVSDSYFHGLLDVAWKKHESTNLGFPLWPTVVVLCALSVTALALFAGAAYLVWRRRNRAVLKRFYEERNCSGSERMSTDSAVAETNSPSASMEDKEADLESPPPAMPANRHPFET
jgi:hypothetical protein